MKTGKKKNKRKAIRKAIEKRKWLIPSIRRMVPDCHRKRMELQESIVQVVGRESENAARRRRLQEYFREPSRVPITDVLEDQDATICQKPVKMNQMEEIRKKMEEKWCSDLSFVDNLEGLVVLGRISEIQDLYLTVDLPGRISGIVPVTNISKEYSSNLKSFIVGENQDVPNENYFIGQFVLVRIESVEGDGFNLKNVKQIKKFRNVKNVKRKHVLIDKQEQIIRKEICGEMKRHEMMHKEMMHSVMIGRNRKKGTNNETRKRVIISGIKNTCTFSIYDKAVLKVRLQEYLRCQDKDKRRGAQNRIYNPDFIPIRDMSINKDTVYQMKVNLSMKPEDINFELSSTDFKIGLCVAAAVHSIEDKVYVMNCGVTNVRAYLSKEQSYKYETLYCNGRSVAVGQVLLCVVNSTSSDSTSTDPIIVSLSLDPELTTKAHPSNMKIKHVPGLIYNVTVSEIVEEGIIVEFSGGERAFVCNQYIEPSEEIKIGQECLARILYIQRSKENKEKVFMTMLHNFCVPEPDKKFIIPGFSGIAKIIRVSANKEWVYLKLGNNCSYGFTAHNPNALSKRLVGKRNAPKEQLTNCEVYYKAKSYDYMTEQFHCQIRLKSNELCRAAPGIVLGERRNCMIESRNRGFLTVLVEFEGLYCLRGIVNWRHYTDGISPESRQLVESRFEIGSLKECKVLSLHPVLELSLKHALVKSNNLILYQTSQVEFNIPYNGIIEEITSDLLKIKFFGNLACGIPRKGVQDGLQRPLKDSYRVGELVTCYIRDIDNDTKDYDMEVKKVENVDTAEDNVHLNNSEQDDNESGDCDLSDDDDDDDNDNEDEDDDSDNEDEDDDSDNEDDDD